VIFSHFSKPNASRQKITEREKQERIKKPMPEKKTATSPGTPKPT